MKWNLFLLSFKIYLVKFQSLRRLALKVTILQAFKVEPFCPQKWSLNRAIKIPCDTNLWCHFGVKIVLTMVDRKEKRKLRGRYCAASSPNQQSCQNTTFTPGIQMYQFPSDLAVRAKWVQFVQRCRHQNKLRYIRHILKSRPTHFEVSSEHCSHWHLKVIIIIIIIIFIIIIISKWNTWQICRVHS